MSATPTSPPATDDYAALAELAGGFIHEIKNHLSTLNLNLQLLAEDFQEPENQRERRALTRVQKLQGECQRLVDLSNDFLHFAHIKDILMEPGDLGKIVEEMIDFFTPTARAANIDIKTFLPADLPALLLNQEMFRRALLNLMLNAVQAMPQGGELTFQASTEFLPSPGTPGEGRGVRAARPVAECSALTPGPSPGVPGEGRKVLLALIDTGAGIAPEVVPKIFRPFFSTKSKTGGTGLGLATTKKIIEAHHGTIDVQSEVGKGTKFTIRLPVPNPG